MEIIIITALLVFVGVLIFAMNLAKKQNQFEANAISGLESQGISLSIQDKLFFGIIGLDQSSNKLVLINFRAKNVRIINFDDILSYELIKDGEVVFKKSTIRTIGGAVLGGFVAGGAGAIIGGLSGDSKQTNKANKIELKIVLRDLSDPSVSFTFFDKIADKKSLYKSISEKAEMWKDRMGIIIDQVDSANKKPS